MTFDFSLHDRTRSLSNWWAPDRTQFAKNSAILNGLRPLFLICVEKGHKDALMKYLSNLNKLKVYYLFEK